MAQRFKDRLVVITGAAGGMGQAFARAFASEGAALVLTDIDEGGLEAAVASLRGEGAKCSGHRVDLASEAGIAELGAKLLGEQPRIDVLINNAGLAYGEIATGFADLSQEKWLRFFAVNTVAPLRLAQALRPALTAARGNIVNITSMASYLPGTAYGVTKAALNAMTFGMAGSFGADGIRVNAIAPGLMETPASRGSLPPETYARVQGQQILKLHGTADDIASLALFLASDDARFITAEIVTCDAGNRLRGWRG
ncbi:MAG TPA: SDR family oxidoreductase [Povalibacter sp.]|uniref:SDR family NAD(P)-dependent oxidoreductase n=1 Tax=Povalibacter sp. TaxID=1962978 RepID=UPI002CA9C951|nr:SDR family oxidoreductase [Povalibacter sp.]HMN47044.1 SDR family oxidoreductase [Povalibacter sp.]